MKKILLLIATIIYMSVSTGIAMDVHYCMGKLAGVEFYGSQTDKCGKCGMKEKGKNGCCHDEHKFVKLEDSHKLSINAIEFKYTPLAIINVLPVYIGTTHCVSNRIVLANYSPPPLNKPSACILNCIFRI